MPHSSNSAGDNTPKAELEPVAVVGIACRFPGDASTPEGFWDLLQSGKSAYSEVPQDRFNINSFHDASQKKQGTITARGAHFLSENVAAFDAPFFTLTANEARAMDPQQRLLLEVSYEAFENAGLRMEDLPGSDTGCFVGCFTKDYSEIMARDPENVPQYTATGTSAAVLSNRLSWFYDLKGPSLTLDTACSSSLVAVHLACQSLQTGETKMAIVGGTNIILNPDLSMALSNLHMLAEDGLSKAFDSRANGYGRGEGIASIILKPLSDAIRNGDCIRAVIRGTGVNQDGKTPGITLPSSQAQEDLIRSTYHRAGLDLSETDYFEAHGTGTSAGDPLELKAISKTFGSTRAAGDEIIVGSCKTNVGHLEGAAGLAGLIKGVFMLERGIIPASIHFNNEPANVNMKELGIRVSKESTRWPKSGLRRLSINSFGFGGTNAHAVLDDAGNYLLSRGIEGNHRTVMNQSGPVSNGSLGSNIQTNGSASKKSPATARKQLVIFSAYEQEAVARVKKSTAEYIQKSSKTSLISQTKNGQVLDDLVFTLGSRRSRLPWKSFAIASSTEELLTQLTSGTGKPVRSSAMPRLAFVLTGQGAQWPRMGVELMKFQAFSKSVEAADAFLSSLGCTWSVIEELHRQSGESRIASSEFSQPLCTVVQVALVDLLKTWKVLPTSVVGHSSGEIAAAYCMGAISSQAAWQIAYFRGRYSAQIATISPNLKGSMMAVGLSEIEAREKATSIKSGKIVVAAINSPTSVTMSGDKIAIDELHDVLAANGTFARKLNVENAYHSHHMEVIAEAYRDSIKDISLMSPNESVRMFSSVTGKLAAAADLGPDYWVTNLVSTVRFSEAVTSLLSHGNTKRRRANVVAADIFLEVGPHPALRGPVQQIQAALGSTKNLPYYSFLERGKSDVETILNTAGTLYTLGSPIDVAEVNKQQVPDAPQHGSQLVDLPPYPWNHSQVFWHESRLSKDFRFRKHPRGHLLGSEAPNFNPLEPEWRNIIRASTHGWIRDHVIQDSMIYPAAGLILMVIEAARQIADSDKRAETFHLRDIRVGKAVVIPDDEIGVECVLKIRPRKVGTRANDSSWLEFTIFSSASEETLVENCSGLLSIEYAVNDNSSTHIEKSIENQTLHLKYQNFVDKSSSPESVPTFYSNLAETGLTYGPFFQNVSQLRKGESYCCSSVGVPDFETLDPDSADTTCALHPGTLDSIFQTAFAGFGQESELREAMVPVFIEGISISSTLPIDKKTEYVGYATSLQHGFREIKSDIVMWDRELQSPKISIKGFQCTKISAIPGAGSQSGQNGNRKVIATKLSWMPDVDLLPAKRTKELMENIDVTFAATPTPKFELAAFLFLTRALKTVAYDQVQVPHLKFFYQWMEKRQKMIQGGNYAHKTADLDWLNVPEATQSAVIAEVRASGSQGEALCLMGDNLEKILTSQVEPLQVLLKDNLLYRFYRDVPEQKFMNAKLIKFLELLTHKNPALSILEIGAGTGGTTHDVVAALGGGDRVPPSFSNYTFTDVGPSFVGKAEEDLAPYKSCMAFKLLDIEQDPHAQGFVDGSHDVIIAANVLHATQKIDKTLENTRKLLKPGGKLCLIEPTNPLLWVGLIFGNLPGWWLGEDDGRHGGPLLTVDRWDPVLKRNGFSGVDLFTQDSDTAADQQLSLIVATVQHEPQSWSGSVILLESKNQSQEQEVISNQLTEIFSSTGLPTKRTTWDSDLSCYEGAHFIVLLEMVAPFLDSLDEEDFASLKKLIDTAGSTLWVTRGDDPRLDLILGLSRTLRSETPNLKFKVLQVTKDNNLDACSLARHISTVATSPGPEMEFKLHREAIEIGRIVEERDMNEAIAGQSRRPEPRMMAMADAHTELKLDIGVPGMLDTLCFIEDTVGDNKLAPDEVEIKVKASGLNFRDVMVAMGQIPDSTLGYEASGIITKIGSSVKSLAVGNRVFTIAKGTHRTTLRNKEILCQLIPETMSFEKAASIPLISCTVYQALVRIANIQKGESVLIHSAAGGVGQVAIQLAKHCGAEIFATVSSAEKKALIMDAYGIPEDHILNSRDLSFRKGIMRMTQDRGVDVVLNSLAGEALRETWLCLAPFGTFVEIGIKDILNNSGLDMLPFLRDTTFASVNLEHIGRARPALLAEIMAGTFDLVRAGAIGAVTPLTTYPASELEDAFRIMQTGQHRGKIVISYNEDDVVPVVVSPAHPLKVESNGTILLVGCLGGLGRSLTKLLTKHGAKHLAFISRSGASSATQQKFISDLCQDGFDARVYLCNVADLKELELTVAQISRDMPPIRGAISGAMVLQDSIFQNMTYSQWTTALKPKVNGSWNLHVTLPKNLDFFILLSSHVGVYGNRGQANYAAGCTFQDALCRYRKDQGMNAVSLDLGIMLGVGYIAEAGGVDALRDWECFGVDEAEFHCLIQAAVMGYTKRDVPILPQVITGLATGGGIDAAGIDIPYYFDNAQMTVLAKTGKGGVNTDTLGNSSSLQDQLTAISTMAEASKLVLDSMVAKVAKNLRTAVQNIETDQALHTFGVDSLVAVELRNWILREIGAEMSLFDITSSIPISSLAEKVATKSQWVSVA